MVIEKTIGSRLFQCGFAKARWGFNIGFMHIMTRANKDGQWVFVQDGNWLTSIRGFFVRGFGRCFEVWYF